MTILSIQFLEVGLVPSANPNNSLPAAKQTPSLIFIATNDTNATVTAAGYLNALQQSTTDNFVFSNTQMALVYTTDDGVNWYQISIAAGTGIITLVPDVSPGNVLLPVAVNHIAAFSNVAGQIADPNATIISRSLIQSGVNNASAGGFIAIPAGNNQGSFRFVPVANAGGFNSILSNTAIGQATTYSLPDPANALARVLVGATATPFVAGNFPVNSGTGGLMQDSGIPVASLQLHTNIIAARSANIGGAGAGPLNIVSASVTAASIIVASIVSSSNPVSIIAVAPGAGSFNVTVSADPGANLVINYVIFVAAQ